MATLFVAMRKDVENEERNSEENTGEDDEPCHV